MSHIELFLSLFESVRCNNAKKKPHFCRFNIPLRGSFPAKLPSIHDRRTMFFASKSEKLVVRGGLEPPTYGLWFRCSNQLSYPTTRNETFSFGNFEYCVGTFLLSAMQYVNNALCVNSKFLKGAKHLSFALDLGIDLIWYPKWNVRWSKKPRRGNYYETHSIRFRPRGHHRRLFSGQPKRSKHP